MWAIENFSPWRPLLKSGAIGSRELNILSPSSPIIEIWSIWNQPRDSTIDRQDGHSFSPDLTSRSLIVQAHKTPRQTHFHDSMNIPPQIPVKNSSFHPPSSLHPFSGTSWRRSLTLRTLTLHQPRLHPISRMFPNLYDNGSLVWSTQSPAPDIQA